MSWLFNSNYASGSVWIFVYFNYLNVRILILAAFYKQYFPTSSPTFNPHIFLQATRAFKKQAQVD